MDGLFINDKLDFASLVFNLKFVEGVIDWIIVVVFAVKFLFECTHSRKLNAFNDSTNSVLFLLGNVGNRSYLRMNEHPFKLL